MRTRTSMLAAVAAAVLAAGCGSSTSSCPTESPQVNAIPADCTVAVGQPLTYPLALCPTCNQTLTVCNVQMQGADATGGTIFLDPIVEACSSSSSCPPSCAAANGTCTFTPPTSSVGVTYTIQVYDAANPSTPRVSHITTGTSTSCPAHI